MSKIIYQKKLPIGLYTTYEQKPSFEFHKCNQVHSNIITPLNKLSAKTQSDGIYSQLPLQTALAIVTADCLPILIIGNKGFIFLHAGWRALATGILSDSQIKQIDPNYIFIGPHISFNKYEVSEDFKDSFPNSSQAFRTVENKLFFSLELETKRQIANLYGPITVESSNICTYETKEFHSYRRNKTTSRNWNTFTNN